MLLSNFEKVLEDKEFRAVYFELLYFQSRIALELACAETGTVQLGAESLEDKMKSYLDKALSTEGFTDTLYNKERIIPPHELFAWLKERIDEVNNLPKRSPESAN